MIDAIERLARRPYYREFIREADGTFFARVPELPGCMTVGDTQAEANAMLDDAIRGWIAVRLEDGDRIPEPAGTR